MPTLPLPPVAERIHEGHHYVCAKIDFALSGQLYRILHWTALIDVESLSVLYLIPYTSGVNGIVFEIDPVTTNGGPAPSGTNATLNPIRVSDVLPGLVPPVAGTQSLVGDNVQLSDVEAPAIAAPTEPTGTNFDFDARTNNFAAVNAYYHCDKFFRLLDGMGFTRGGYFGGSTFPSPVDHRGSINVATGIEINAHCLGTAGGVGILQTTFALADTGDLVNPLGIACDYRVVLHELGGHGVLYNHVHSANFGFAHSAGDSIAAVLNDAGSRAPDRFVTFPWVNIGRRHDRTPAAGWGWAGNIALNPFVCPDPTNPVTCIDRWRLQQRADPLDESLSNLSVHWRRLGQLDDPEIRRTDDGLSDPACDRVADPRRPIRPTQPVGSPPCWRPILATGSPRTSPAVHMAR